MRTCPKCFKQSPDEAVFCGFCGASMAPAAPTAKAGAEKKTMFGYAAKDMLQQLGQAPAAATAAKSQPAMPIAAAAPAIAAAPVASPPAANANIVGGRFQLVGEGVATSVGVKHKALDTTTHAGVELLFVHDNVFASPLDMERARREFRQLQQADSTHIVKVIDHGKTDAGKLFVATELIEGTSLLDLVAEKGAMPVAAVQTLLNDVGQALAEGQKVGVLHRDIAPQNVVVLTNGHAKLTGFGLAPYVAPNVFGTPEYLSPEQAAGRPVDQRSNIYSLGALLTYMITGVPPFSGTPTELIDKHQNAEPPSLQQLNPRASVTAEMDTLVAKALAKSSSKRHLTLKQFLREIETMGGGTMAQAAAVAETQRIGAGATEVKPHDVVPLVTQKPSGPIPTILPASASSMNAAGELGGVGKLVAADPHDKAPPPKEVPTGGQGGGRPGFRETMWFFKGEMDSQLSQKGEGDTHAAAVEEGRADLSEIQDKYQDDGSLNREEAARLSLRTGKTQMMQAIKVPENVVPGRQMDADEFIKEMNEGRKVGIIIGIGVGVVILGAILFFVLR